MHPPVRVLALPAAVVRHVAPRAPLEEHAVLLRPHQSAESARGVLHAVPPPRRHERRLRADHLLARKVGFRIRLRVPIEPEVVVAVALRERGSAEAILHRISLRGDAEVGREGLVVAARLHQGLEGDVQGYREGFDDEDAREVEAELPARAGPRGRPQRARQLVGEHPEHLRGGGADHLDAPARGLAGRDALQQVHAARNGAKVLPVDEVSALVRVRSQVVRRRRGPALHLEVEHPGEIGVEGGVVRGHVAAIGGEPRRHGAIRDRRETSAST
mmetsp:Transcript_7183/g.31663  ORF Transcript_7183/g.31663 Transcript_7183/m.31663 type:complete len:273 (-) Transcript_7183:31-849(-)